MKMKKIKESQIQRNIRRQIVEGSLESAESSLAAKDLVDRLQDMVEELGKMSNDELPHLVDSIRGSLGAEAATQYQTTAASVLDELLTTVKDRKASLENATLILTGDAPLDAGAGLGAPALDADALPTEDEPDPELDSELEGDAESDVEKEHNPLGRETRIPTEAKIIALDRALREVNAKKYPAKARRLAEELRRVATIGIREAAEKKKAKKNKLAFDLCKKCKKEPCVCKKKPTTKK